jgi:hypothetical protein
VYEAIRTLEQIGVLSWVNRIKRVREYVPGLFGNPVQRRCAERGRRQRFDVAWPWRGSSVRRRMRQRADQTVRTAAPVTRCNDVARISQFRRLTRFGNYATTPRGHTGKRELSTILKRTNAAFTSC